MIPDLMLSDPILLGTVAVIVWVAFVVVVIWGERRG